MSRLVQLIVANNLLRLVLLHHELNEFDLARLAYTEAIPYLRRAHGDDHPLTLKAMKVLTNTRRASEWKPFQGRTVNIFMLGAEGTCIDPN
jgi:hypothetical protein